jgi:hypothetical protein
LLAIAAHALANTRENILGLLGGGAVERYHTAEFDDRRHTAAAIYQRWQELGHDSQRWCKSFRTPPSAHEWSTRGEAGSVGSKFS